MSSTLGAYMFFVPSVLFQDTCSLSLIYCIYFILNLYDIFVRERSTIPNMQDNSLFDNFWEFKTWERRYSR